MLLLDALKPARDGHAHRTVTTVEDVRDALRAAARTIRLLPTPRHSKPAPYRAAWPDVVQDWMAYGYTDARAPRATPSAAQISQLDATLEWLHWLTRDQRIILWARAQGFTWRQVEAIDENYIPRGGKRGRCQQTLRAIAQDGEARILSRLNGTPPRLRLELPERMRA